LFRIQNTIFLIFDEAPIKVIVFKAIARGAELPVICRMHFIVEIAALGSGAIVALILGGKAANSRGTRWRYRESVEPANISGKRGMRPELLTSRAHARVSGLGSAAGSSDREIL
jgi:hypothetical protein